MNENGNGKAPITCPACNQRFSAAPPVLDPPMNMLRFSAVVATHEKPIRCPNAKCGQYFVFIAQAVEISWQPLPITAEQAATLVESKIIIPSLDFAPRLH